jgi:hypothetical protein
MSHDNALAELIDRYCAGRMSESEQEAFEVRMLTEPQLAAQVDATQRLRLGLQQLERQGEIDALAKAAHPGRRRYYLAAAACVLVAVLTAILYRAVTPESPRLAIAASLAELAGPSAAVPRLLGSHLLVSARSDGDTNPIKVPATGGALLLQAFPDTPASSGRYYVRIRDTHDAVLTSREDFSANGEGLVLIYLDAHALPAGDYQIEIGPAEHLASGRDRTRFRVRIL